MAVKDQEFTNLNDLAEAAHKEELELIEKEKAEKAKLDAAMKEKEPAEKPTTTKPEAKEPFASVKSEPFLEDDKEDEGDPLKVELRKRAEEKKDSIFKRTKKKVAIKLGKLAFVIADAERFVYEKFHLNEPLMSPEEIDADYIETYNDTQELINNRIGIESEHGDIWNVGITVGSHFAKRGFRYYTRKDKRHDVDNSFNSREGEGEEEEMPAGLTQLEEARWLIDKAQREGRNVAP
jgi:hypothetical protein